MEVQRDILIACSVGDLEWLEKSIARTVKSITGMIDHEGLTPLHVAAKYSHAHVLAYLLDKFPDTDVNVASIDHGETPLHSCLHLTTSTRIVECLKLLLNKGANCNKVNHFLRTPTHIAAEAGLTEVVKLLLSNGASDSIKDKNNHTPLDLAKLNGHYECARLLQALLWARQKNSSAEARLHVQRAMKEQMRIQLSLQRAVKEQDNQAAYQDWLEQKKVTEIKPPQQPKQKKNERLSNTATTTNDQPMIDSKSSAARKLTSGHSSVKTEKKRPVISKIEISLDQAKHNTVAVGKPNQLYPYLNYPPRAYRKHTPQQRGSLTRPNSSRSYRSKQGRSYSRMSTKSLPTPRMGGSTPTPTMKSEKTSSCLPPSYLDYSIHKPNRDIHEHGRFTNSNNVLSQETEENQMEEEEGIEESSSSSSIDGLTFHEVGPENNLQTLINSGEAGSSSAFSTLTPIELVELFRLSQENATPKFHRRHSTGGNARSRHRSKYQRAISLSAIPEGEIVTRYDEQQKEGGSRLFDEKFLLSLMPYAFEKSNQQEDKEMEIEALDNGNDSLAPNPALPKYSDGNANKTDTIKVVTVAWDDNVNEVKTVLLEEKKLSPRFTPSPPVSPVDGFRSLSDTILSKSNAKESRSHADFYESRNRGKSADGKNKTSIQTGSRNVLKTTLYKFGGDLVYTK